MKYTKEMSKEDADVSKAEIFKKYFWKLIENAVYKKAKKFREYFYRCFNREGQENRVCVYY